MCVHFAFCCLIPRIVKTTDRIVLLMLYLCLPRFSTHTFLALACRDVHDVVGSFVG